MVKYVLCLVTILLLVVDAFIYFDLKKYIKVHENELVENHIKGLLGRAVAMTVISVCVGVIAIILQIQKKQKNLQTLKGEKQNVQQSRDEHEFR